MKNIIAILMFSFISLSVSAQYGVDNIFRKYKNNKGVIAWQFEGNISKLLKTKDGSSIKSTLESVDFVMFSDGANIEDNDKKKLKERIESDGYDLLVQARDKGQKVKIMGIQDGDTIKKVFAQLSMENINAYFFLTGDIHIGDLNNIEYDSLFDGLNFD